MQYCYMVENKLIAIYEKQENNILRFVSALPMDNNDLSRKNVLETISSHLSSADYVKKPCHLCELVQKDNFTIH